MADQKQTAQATETAKPAETKEVKLPGPVEKFHRLIVSLGPQTPSEQVMFGAGGIKMTAGDLRFIHRELLGD